MNIAFKRLTEVSKGDIISLMNNEQVRKQMPLLKGVFTESHCDQFIASKERLWQEDGYGPWAFVIDKKFAGWGGLQNEDGDADLAIVLHPDFWGAGKQIFKEVTERAFEEMKLPSITILLPPSRTRIHAIFRLGFEEDGSLEINNETFLRFRLLNPNVSDS